MKVYDELFREIIKVAQEEGTKFRKLQIVDSVHLAGDVNITKDRLDKSKVSLQAIKTLPGERRATRQWRRYMART